MISKEEAKPMIKKLILDEIGRIPGHYDSEVGDIVYDDNHKLYQLLETKIRVSYSDEKVIREDERSIVVEEYKNRLLKRLIPDLDKLACAKYSETYLAITEIAEELSKTR